MLLIRKDAWSHDIDAYIIKEFELHLKPTEMLIITDALRMLRDDEGKSQIDRTKADKMLEEIQQRSRE